MTFTFIYGTKLFVTINLNEKKEKNLISINYKLNS